MRVILSVMQIQAMQIPTDEQQHWETLSDEQVMLRYAQGDSDAFDELYQRHKSSVYAFIRNFIYDANAIDDLFQAVFLKMIRNRLNFIPKAKFTTWLFTIARTTCIDAMRKTKTSRVIQLFPDQYDEDAGMGMADFPDCEPQPREKGYQTELQHAIDGALEMLPQEQREVLLLREKTELTFQEIGKITGCSTNTAKSRMHYALLAIRKELQEKGFDEP